MAALYAGQAVRRSRQRRYTTIRDSTGPHARKRGRRPMPEIPHSTPDTRCPEPDTRSPTPGARHRMLGAHTRGRRPGARGRRPTPPPMPGAWARLQGLRLSAGTTPAAWADAQGPTPTPGAVARRSATGAWARRGATASAGAITRGGSATGAECVERQYARHDNPRAVTTATRGTTVPPDATGRRPRRPAPPRRASNHSAQPIRLRPSPARPPGTASLPEATTPLGTATASLSGLMAGSRW
jgi:hypothetical protein